MLPVNFRLIFRPQLAAILGLYRSSVLCGCNTWSKCWNTMEYFGGSFHDLYFHDPASCSQLLHLVLSFIFSDKISYKRFMVVLFVLSYYSFRRYLGFHRPEVLWRPYWEETVCAIAIETFFIIVFLRYAKKHKQLCNLHVWPVGMLARQWY